MGFMRLARARQAWTTAIAAVWLGRGKQAMARSTGDAELPTPRLPPPRFGERITVLSIDGGGIRGLIPSVVLASLEQELQNLDGKNARMADYFDVIAGTSTGALIAAMLVTPDKNTNRPRSAEEIKKLYLEIGPKIFPPLTRAQKLARMVGGPIYDHKFLHAKIRDITGDLRLDQTLTTILVPAFDVRRLFPRIFSSYKQYGEERAHDKKSKLSDVCIGTSAAPTLFPAHHFDGIRDGGVGHGTVWARFHLIDGGVSANNPTMSALMKVASEILCGNEDFPEGCVDFTKFTVISVGTGTFKEAETEMYTAEECAKWGGLHWVYDWWRNRHPIIDVLTRSSDFLVDRDVSMLFSGADPDKNLSWGTLLDIVFEPGPVPSLVITWVRPWLFYSLGCDKNYLRIQAMVDPKVNILSMDNASKKNMNGLIKIGQDLLTEPVARVSKITGMHDRTGDTNDDRKLVTNQRELKHFAEILSKERKRRLEKKEEEDARQAANEKEP